MTHIGVDVGGTKCLGVRVDDHGALQDELRRPTPDAANLITELCVLVEQLRTPETQSLGVGLPGLVTKSGVFRTSPHISGITDVEVKTLLEDHFDFPVVVDNDATAAAFGEWKIGAARNAENAIVVSIGTGIGGGIVMGGQMQRGAQGFAGEIGHIVVDVDGAECECGQQGCWETVASGDALVLLSGGLSGPEVMSLAARADSWAEGVVDEFSRWVARGLATLINVCDPQIVVIGGGVVTSEAQFVHKLPAYVSQYLYSSSSRMLPEIVPAGLGEKAAAIGSALLGALQ